MQSIGCLAFIFQYEKELHFTNKIRIMISAAPKICSLLNYCENKRIIQNSLTSITIAGLTGPFRFSPQIFKRIPTFRRIITAWKWDDTPNRTSLIFYFMSDNICCLHSIWSSVQSPASMHMWLRLNIKHVP